MLFTSLLTEIVCEAYRSRVVRMSKQSERHDVKAFDVAPLVLATHHAS
jgi:hypothetical protein